jgi:hypothetical protein
MPTGPQALPGLASCYLSVSSSTVALTNGVTLTAELAAVRVEGSVCKPYNWAVGVSGTVTVFNGPYKKPCDRYFPVTSSPPLPTLFGWHPVGDAGCGGQRSHQHPAERKESAVTGSSGSHPRNSRQPECDSLAGCVNGFRIRLDLGLSRP